MYSYVIQFLALFLLMLVTGIFWGPWFSLHRSIKVFNISEFIHIVNTMAANLAVPMRLLMPSCILLMLLSVCIYPQINSPGFYFSLSAFVLTVVSLLVTLAVEVPIINQITKWTGAAYPTGWETIRDRWVKFHVVRTCSSLISFGCFTASILLLH